MKAPSDELKELLSQFGDLEERALAAYTPLVNDLIRTQCRDTNLIERTLDGLLDFSENPDVRELYRSLCEYLATLENASAEFYTTELAKLLTDEATDR
jgi:hypothetical protein